MFRINCLALKEGRLFWLSTVACALGFTLTLLPAVSLQAEEKSNLYRIGEAAAFARYCGHASLSVKAREHFGGYRDFKRGLDKNLLPESYIWDVDCGGLEKDLTDYFDKVKARQVKFPPGDPEAHVTLNAEERNVIELQVYDDLMSRIMSEGGTWDDRQDGNGNAPIATYTDFEQGRINVKNLAACLKWNKVSTTVDYLAWRAHLRRGWWRSQKFTLEQCNLARERGDLDCSCRSIDRGGERVLELPDYILTAYKRRMDVRNSAATRKAQP